VTLRCLSERPLWAIADVRREAGLSDGVEILKHTAARFPGSATIGFPTFHEVLLRISESDRSGFTKAAGVSAL